MHEFEMTGSIDDFLLQVQGLAGRSSAWAATWTAKGSNSFPVRLVKAGGRITGDFGGLLTDFDTLEAALFWAKRAASPGWRLRIDLVGGRPKFWQLERCDATGKVTPGLASGHLGFLDRFRPRTRQYRSNIGTTSPDDPDHASGARATLH